MEMTGAAKPRVNENHNFSYDGTAKDELRAKIGNMVGDVIDAIAADAEFVDVEIKELTDGSDAATDTAP